MRFLWYWRWKWSIIMDAVRCKFDPGGHHFIDGVCHCGQRTTNDPVMCGYCQKPLSE